MHLIYIDDSRDEKLGVFSALTVPAEDWHSIFETIRIWRRGLRKTDGIYVYKEFHAWKFVSGRGRLATQRVAKGRRCEIFKDGLGLLAETTGFRLFNATFPPKKYEKAFDILQPILVREASAKDPEGIVRVG